MKYALYMMGMLAWVLLLSSCMQKNVTIRDVAGSPVSSHAAGQLSDYLNEIYDHANFTVAEKNGDADIFLMLSEQAKDFQWVHLPEKEDSYMVKSQDGKL